MVDGALQNAKNVMHHCMLVASRFITKSNFVVVLIEVALHFGVTVLEIR